MSEIYARDLNPRIANDSFMGKGFEKLLAKAEKEDKELIIGEFYANKDWRLE